MPSTGFRSPALVGIAGTGTTWTNRTLITADDGSTASCNLTGSSRSMVPRSYGFTEANLPLDATILGIEISVDRSTDFSGIGISDLTVRLRDVDGDLGINQADFQIWPTTLTKRIYGGPENTLGISEAKLVPATFHQTSFGMNFAVVNNDMKTAHTAFVDWIGINIYYSVPASPSRGGMRLGFGLGF